MGGEREEIDAEDNKKLLTDRLQATAICLMQSFHQVQKKTIERVTHEFFFLEFFFLLIILVSNGRYDSPLDKGLLPWKSSLQNFFFFFLNILSKFFFKKIKKRKKSLVHLTGFFDDEFN